MPSAPWPQNFIHQVQPSHGHVKHLQQVLADATDESTLQTALAAAPVLWRPLMPASQAAWCFDRPSLGGEFIPDFLLCHRNSTGYSWTMVELESPTKTPLNQNGRVAAKLTEALGQISDWRIWLRENIAFAQGHLGFRQLSAECQAIVVIGRRHMISPAHSLRYREISSGSVSVMTYDRLIEAAQSQSLA